MDVKIHDLSSCQIISTWKDLYGSGTNGEKITVQYDNSLWMIKGPVIKNKVFHNLPVYEYLSSHIFASCLDTHQTILCKIDGFSEHVLVACKHVYSINTEKLVTWKDYFRQYQLLRNKSFQKKFVSLTMLSLCLEKFEQLLSGSAKFFWSIFVIDFLICNKARHLNNLGLIIDDTGNIRLSPVYDNANSFFVHIADENLPCVDTASFSTRYTDMYDKRLSSRFILEYMPHYCKALTSSILEKMDMGLIAELVNNLYSLKLLSLLRKNYILDILKNNYDKLTHYANS